MAHCKTNMTHVENKGMDTKGGEGGMNRAIAIDKYRLLCKIDNYTVVYSTVNSTQCSAVT